MNLTKLIVKVHRNFNIDAPDYESLDWLTEHNNQTGDYLPYERRVETYLVPVLFAILFITGLLGNITLIYIFIRNKSMRNVPNLYICSLAVGDLLVIFFCVPFTSTVYTVESWPYGLIVCKFSEFIKDVSIGVSVFTLTALSADRYFAISDPMRTLTGTKATRVTCCTIIGIWICSILFALPSVIYSYVREIETIYSTFSVCYPFPPELSETYPKAIVLLRFLIFYTIPLLFIATFYCLMANELMISTRNLPGEEAQRQGKQIQARKKVAKMVLSFVVIFAICFLPNHIFLLWFYYDPNSEENYNQFWHVVRIVAFCLGFINSSINPFALYCLSGTFRKYFNQYLFCCCTRKQRRTYGPRGVSSYYMRGSNTGRNGRFRDSTMTTMSSIHGKSRQSSTQEILSHQQLQRLSQQLPRNLNNEEQSHISTISRERFGSNAAVDAVESTNLISLSLQGTNNQTQYCPLSVGCNEITEENEEQCSPRKQTSLF